MSFIGADGQDHLIKSLKAQVQSKGACHPPSICIAMGYQTDKIDGELASVQNELAKCKEQLGDEKKARQGLEYQVSTVSRQLAIDRQFRSM